MKFIDTALVSAALFLSCANGQEKEAAITEDAGNYLVRGSNYEAVVGADGCMSSLKCGGVEFFRSVPKGIPRGGYLFRDGLLTATVTKAAPGVLEATSEGGSIRYEFHSDHLTWKIKNSDTKGLSYVVVFDSGVDAVQGDWGRWTKTPARKSWKNTLWFRDQTSLRITGGSRIWGPWNEKHQVWQADVPAKGAMEIELKPNAATEAERSRALAIVQAPPPPPPVDPTGPMWDLNALSKPPRTWPAEGFSPSKGEEGSGETVRAVFFQGPAYQGRETRVFAWIGLPKVAPGTKVPGMVLVHGGGVRRLRPGFGDGRPVDTQRSPWTPADRCRKAGIAIGNPTNGVARRDGVAGTRSMSLARTSGPTMPWRMQSSPTVCCSRCRRSTPSAPA